MGIGVAGAVVILAAVTSLTAYFLGCFNGAVIVSKYFLHDDVRKHGSGNAGLTNFYRKFGPRLAVVVLACDMLKAILAVAIGGAVFGHFFGNVLSGQYWAGLFCLVGHMFPCMFHFKGGKGVLSGGAIALMIDWRVALAVWGIFLIMFLLTRYVSLGSVCAAILYAVSTAVTFGSAGLTVLASLSGALIVWQHRENLSRLFRGQERKFHFHREKDRKEE